VNIQASQIVLSVARTVIHKVPSGWQQQKQNSNSNTVSTLAQTQPQADKNSGTHATEQIVATPTHTSKSACVEMTPSRKLPRDDFQ
jgi:hypothetical protein